MAAVTKKKLDNVVSGASVRDALGRKIHTTYATKTELNAVDDDVTALETGTVKKSEIVNNVTSEGETGKPLGAGQGYVLQSQIDEIMTLLQSNDTDLDTIQEIVTFIKGNKSLIESITTEKVSVSDIIDNLTSNVSNKPLSAKQGKLLSDALDALTGRVSTAEGSISTNASGISTNAGAIAAEEARAKAEEGAIKTRVTTLEGQVVTLDNSVTAASNNGVKSSGIYTYFDDRGLTSVENMSFDDWEA